MQLILRGMLGICAMVFIDDILVYSRTFEQHLLDLDRVLSCIGQAGMTINMDKCSFFSPSVEYLGHVISDEGIRVCHKKVEAVRAFPSTPENATDVRSFLGVANFYRRFIQNFL